MALVTINNTFIIQYAFKILNKFIKLRIYIYFVLFSIKNV